MIWKDGMTIRRGDIHLAILDPVVGREISKTRPVVVISNDKNNEFAATVTVLPVTSNTERIYPFEVFLPKGVGNLPKDSKVKADQVRTIDKSRLISRLGSLGNEAIEQIEHALKIHLGLR